MHYGLFEFFITFSRFEYALKSAGYSNGDEKGIAPSWNKFAASIKDKFDKNKSQEINAAIEYLLKDPPKKQILEANILAFKERSNLEELHLVFRLQTNICDIRNNLFHGGKFDGNFEPEVSRNYILLSHALTVMNEWLTLDESVNHYFSKEIPR